MKKYKESHANIMQNKEHITQLVDFCINSNAF